MKGLKTTGVWALVAIAAGVLALAGCTPGNPTPQPGGAIVTPWETGISGNPGATTFTISTRAELAAPHAGLQTVEYAVGTSSGAPSSTPQDGLTFTNLQPGTDYWVFARAKENSGYTAGAWARASGDDVNPVTTNPAGQDASVAASWAPIPAAATTGIYSLDGTTFSIEAAEPTAAFAGRQVEYLLAQTGDPAAAAASAQWQDGLSMRFNTITNPTQQYRLWARAAAAGTNPAGFPLGVDLKLPGAIIGLTGAWSASADNITSSSATVTVTGTVPKTPSAAANLTLEYAIAGGTTGATVAPTSGWLELSSGSRGFSDLTPSAEQHLWVRTKGGPNFREGTPVKYEYPNTSYLFRTGTSLTTAEGLVEKLNGITAGCATAAGNNVVLTSKVTLTDTLTIPDGVTLFIDTNGELDAKTNLITGGGSITVSAGTLTVGFGGVSVAEILVMPGGTYSVDAQGMKLELIGTGKVIVLTNSTVSVKWSGNRCDYTLERSVGNDPKAVISKELVLKQGDTFTVKSLAKLEITNGGLVSGGGTLQVESGGEIDDQVGIATYKGLDTNGKLVINSGANVSIKDALSIGRNTTASATFDKAINLISGQMVLSHSLKPGTTTDVYTFSLTGNAELAKKVEVGYVLDIRPGYTLTIPQASGTALELEVKGANGALLVNGTLEIQEASTTPAKSGGSLKINGGDLRVGGTINVKTDASFEIADGTATVSRNGNININSKSAEIKAGTVTLDGTITINSANVTTSDAKLKIADSVSFISAVNTGKIDVKRYGQLAAKEDVFLQAATSPFGGSVVVSGEWFTDANATSPPYIGTVAADATDVTNYPKTGFRLGASSNITFKVDYSSGSPVRYYTVPSGSSAYVEGTSPPPNGPTSFEGKFEVSGTLYIGQNKILELAGTDPELITNNKLSSGTTGVGSGGWIQAATGATGAKVTGTVPNTITNKVTTP